MYIYVYISKNKKPGFIGFIDNAAVVSPKKKLPVSASDGSPFVPPARKKNWGSSHANSCVWKPKVNTFCIILSFSWTLQWKGLFHDVFRAGVFWSSRFSQFFEGFGFLGMNISWMMFHAGLSVKCDELHELRYSDTYASAAIF